MISFCWETVSLRDSSSDLCREPETRLNLILSNFLRVSSALSLPLEALERASPSSCTPSIRETFPAPKSPLTDDAALKPPELAEALAETEPAKLADEADEEDCARFTGAFVLRRSEDLMRSSLSIMALGM